MFDNIMGIAEPSVIFGDGDCTEVITKQEATVLSAAISYWSYRHLTGHAKITQAHVSLTKCSKSGWLQSKTLS